MAPLYSTLHQYPCSLQTIHSPFIVPSFQIYIHNIPILFWHDQFKPVWAKPWQPGPVHHAVHANSCVGGAYQTVFLHHTSVVIKVQRGSRQSIRCLVRVMCQSFWCTCRWLTGAKLWSQLHMRLRPGSRTRYMDASPRSLLCNSRCVCMCALLDLIFSNCASLGCSIWTEIHQAWIHTKY